MFRDIVSSQKPFGFRTFVKGKKNHFPNSVLLYQNGGIGFVSRNEVVKNSNWIDKFKIVIPRSSPGGDTYPHQVLGRPILSAPGSCCTETYIVIGPFDDENTTKNVISYIQTKFFRFLVILIKNTQDVPRKVYNFVPMQDFNVNWTDEKLFDKYEITKDEQLFIDSLVRPM